MPAITPASACRFKAFPGVSAFPIFPANAIRTSDGGSTGSTIHHACFGGGLDAGKKGMYVRVISLTVYTSVLLLSCFSDRIEEHGQRLIGRVISRIPLPFRAETLTGYPPSSQFFNSFLRPTFSPASTGCKAFHHQRRFQTTAISLANSKLSFASGAFRKAPTCFISAEGKSERIRAEELTTNTAYSEKFQKVGR
jgi:hypothetical protein